MVGGTGSAKFGELVRDLDGNRPNCGEGFVGIACNTGYVKNRLPAILVQPVLHDYVVGFPGQGIFRGEQQLLVLLLVAVPFIAIESVVFCLCQAPP